MLEHVALHQTRFHAPGITPDARGVVLGKLGALLFPSVDRLVGFLAVLSDEMPLDDLLPTLKIVEVTTPLRSREFLVLLQANTSYLMDRAARIARFHGSLAFTGTNKHFVKYRDEAAPLGYDTDQLSTETADFLLYGDSFVHVLHRVREMPFQQLLFRLSLRPLPGRKDELTDRELVWLTVERGLARSVIGYLWRNRVAVSAALVEPDEATQQAFGRRPGYLLARVGQLPERMLTLFREVPGIEVHRPVADNVMVELGYRHPLRLEACQAVFEKDRFYLFSGRRDGVDVLAGPPPLVGGERLLAANFDLGAGEKPRLGSGRPVVPPRVEVLLKLVPSAAPPRQVTATLVPWERAAWLKQLVFALPPTALTGYRVAPIDEGLLVVGAQGVDGLPIGELLEEAAPSIYVPVGYHFLPRVSEAVLADHVGGVAGRCVVFLRGAVRPIGVPDELFEPLGRRVLGRLEVDVRSRSPRLPPTPPPTEPLVENDPVGPFPLWGFRRGPVPDVDG